jgi:hypothetical protein
MKMMGFTEQVTSQFKINQGESHREIIIKSLSSLHYKTAAQKIDSEHNTCYSHQTRIKNCNTNDYFICELF